MHRDDKTLLADILEAVKRIESYVGELNYKQFLNDIKTQDSVVRNLEIIGEAVRKISKELKDKYPLIAWRDMLI